DSMRGSIVEGDLLGFTQRLALTLGRKSLSFSAFFFDLNWGGILLLRLIFLALLNGYFVLELLDRAIPAPEVVGDRSGEALLDVPFSSRRKRASKEKVADYTSSDDSSASCDETNKEGIDPVAPDDHNSLPGGFSPLHRGEQGSTSQATADFLPEDESDEPPPHYPFPGTAEIDGGNTTFTFSELGLSTEQYSSAPVKAYVPMPVEERPATGGASASDPHFCDQLFSWGIAGPYSIPATSGDGGPQQTDYNPEPSILPFDGGNFDPYPADLSSSSQGFYAEQSDLVRPSNPEVEVEERNSSPGDPPHLDDGGSPPLEIDALSGHGIEWPARNQPGPFSVSDDFWGLLLDRVRAVMDAENPPPTEAVRRVLEENTTIAFNMGSSRDRWMGSVEEIWGEVCRRHARVAWAPYDQRIQALESDICSLTNDADERDSRATEVRKRQKTRASKIAAERERVARLQRELDEARSSLDQEAREAAEESEEEATFARDGGKLRQSDLDMARLDGLLAMGLEFEFDFAYHCGLPVGLLDLDLVKSEKYKISP
ncbi:hypothetical protein Taro_028446, partial [Colocasia esculenta]|nr:hypothetical protein [Colocasia esculenta]